MVTSLTHEGGAGGRVGWGLELDTGGWGSVKQNVYERGGSECSY